MKVSIIIPVYNVEKYIDECILSAVNQTIKEIEIIVVNDGSTDSSFKIAREYEEKYNNVRVINQKNKGLSGARNSGIYEAKGEYIYFLDSDDYIELDSMEYCFNIAKEDDLDIVIFDAKSFKDKEYVGPKLVENYNRSKKLKSVVMSGSEFFNYSISNKGYETPVWLNFYKREFIELNNLYFYEGIIHEDEIHTFKSLNLASKVKYIPKQFFNRRVRSNSIMTTKKSYKNAYSMKLVARGAYNFYNEHKNTVDELTCHNMINKIRFLYWAAIMYCDKMDEDINIKSSLRKEIVEQILEVKDVMTPKLEEQIYRPKKYYFKEDMKLKIKATIKNSEYNNWIRRVVLCLKKK